MPEHQNPFVRKGLLRRIAPFAAALAAGFVMVPVIAPGRQPLSAFSIAAGLTALIVLMVGLLPWRKLPTWLQLVPPLLYMVVVAKLYAIGGGPSSGFGYMILLPILWLALWGTQAQMIASVAASAVVVIGPQILLGHAVNADAEYRRGILILIVGPVMGFTVQRLVAKLRARATEETERADTLEEATQQFDRAFTTAPIGMAIMTVAGRFMRVNPALCSMVGRAREDLIGRKLEEMIYAEDRATGVDAMPKLIKGEVATYQAEKRLTHIDGNVVWVMLSMTLVRDSQGTPRHFFAQMQDVTARHLAEDRVREAEERYRTMVEQLPLVTYIDALDDVSSTIYISPQVEPLLGYPVERWIEDKDLFVKLLHPDDRERVMQSIDQCNKSGQPFLDDYRLIASDGRVVWIRDEAHHARDKDGGLHQMQGLMMDVTERKEAETRLRLQHSVASTIAGANSLREATPAVLESICEAMDWQVGALWQADPRLNELRCVDFWSDPSLELDEFERATREWTFRDGEGLPGQVWSEGAPETRPDFPKQNEFPRGGLLAGTDVRAAVAFPVRASGRELGVIEFFGREISQLHDNVKSLMVAIAGQLGQFMERMQAEDRLREAEERYRRLVERLPAITYIAAFGESGKWLYVSPQVEAMLGYSPSEWTAAPELWLRQVHPDDRERALEQEREARETGAPLASEYRMFARDGTIRWFRDEAIVIEDDSGRATYMSGLMTDITEQKVIEQALRDSEKRFRVVGTQAPVAIFETDADGNCIFVNERWCELAGMEADQAMGLNWGRAIHPDDRDAVFSKLGSALEGAEQFNTDCRVLTPRGEVRWVTASAVPLRDVAGTTAGYLATVVDVTDRVRTEQYQSIQSAVSKAMAESRSYEDAITRMIAALGAEMGWQLGVFWQSEVQRVATESIGRPVPLLRCLQTWHAPDIAADAFVERCRQMTFSSPLGMLGRVWEGGQGEWSVGLGDARSKRAQLAVDLGMNGSVCLPVFGDGKPLGVLEFFGRSVEDPGELFLDLHSGIGRQIGEYMARKRAEGEADRAKDEFFALVSHELRTPLTSIIGYLELMQEGDSDMEVAEQRHFLDIVHRNADRLLRLVGDLLLVAQVQAGKFALRPGPVDLGAIAEQAVEAVQPIAKGRTIALVLKAASVPVFQGDHDRIAQLFDNLISNALKFTKPGERIEVRTSVKGERAIVEVHNSGSVIPESERAHLFDRFFRASDATSSVAPGVGLGLAIVKAIVEAHGGTIRVESDAAVGTTFKFSLPLVDVERMSGATEDRRAA